MFTDSGIAVTGATDGKGVVPFDLTGSGSDTTTVADTGTTNGNRITSTVFFKGRASVLHGHVLLQYTCIIISLIIYIVRYHISLY